MLHVSRKSNIFTNVTVTTENLNLWWPKNVPNIVGICSLTVMMLFPIGSKPKQLMKSLLGIGQVQDLKKKMSYQDVIHKDPSVIL